jgi:hypothetical protein
MAVRMWKYATAKKVLCSRLLARDEARRIAANVAKLPCCPLLAACALCAGESLFAGSLVAGTIRLARS